MLARPASGFFRDSQVRRPITTGLPIVTRTKCAISSGNRQGIVLSRPITPLRAMATTSAMRTLDRDRRANGRMGIVAFEREILEGEAIDVAHRRIEFHRGQRARS